MQAILDFKVSFVKQSYERTLALYKKGYNCAMAIIPVLG